MFLYERVLILCKKQETTGDYNFKIEFELDGLKIEDDKSKQNRFSFGFEIGKLQFNSHHLRTVLILCSPPTRRLNEQLERVAGDLNKTV